MSFFYPQSRYNRSPFYDVTDPSPYLSSSPHHHHRYSAFDPLGLTHPQDDLGNAFHPSLSIPRDPVVREPLTHRHQRYSRPYPVPINPTSYEDAIRAERARRLAEAKMRQQAQSQADEQTEVLVTLPDNRQCVVPLSWAKKMQSKYPNILTNAMIQPHNPPSPPSPPPIGLDHQNDSDHDSDFYILDPTQDPSVPSLAEPSPIPPRQSPISQPPKHSQEEIDSAARLIQQQFKTYQSLKRLDQIESTMHQLRDSFTYPSLLDLTFIESPQKSSRLAPSKLAFNNPVNRAILAFEEGLTQLQIKADAVVSRGNLKIKNWRKRLIKEIDSQLEQLDRFKSEAWNSQKVSHNSLDCSDGEAEQLSTSQPKNADSTNAANKCDDVEMNEEIVNTDNESVASNGCNNDDSAASLPLLSKLEAVQPATRSDENLIIPMTSPPGTSLENVVIPASSAPKSHPNNGSSCIVNPIVTPEGDLVCHAAPHNPDDILVSPI